MKRLFLLMLTIVFIGCSSKDDGKDETLDSGLLQGQWYKLGLCESQNSLLLNSNSNYVSYFSGGQDCEDPAPDTYKYVGTYQVNGKFINFNLTSSELVIDGTDLIVQDFELPGYKNEIIELTPSSLVIKTTRVRDNGSTEILETANYIR